MGNAFSVDSVQRTIYRGILKSVPYWVKHLNATNAIVATKIQNDTARNAVHMLLGTVICFRVGFMDHDLMVNAVVCEPADLVGADFVTHLWRVLDQIQDTDRPVCINIKHDNVAYEPIVASHDEFHLFFDTVCGTQ